jgi:hypothetical protein
VAQRIIGLFQLVEVDEQDGQHELPLAPADGSQIDVQRFESGAAIQKTGQRITRGPLEELPSLDLVRSPRSVSSSSSVRLYARAATIAALGTYSA